MVLALGELPRGEGATKADIIESSAPFCDDDLVRPPLNSNLLASNRCCVANGICILKCHSHTVAEKLDSQGEYFAGLLPNC